MPTQLFVELCSGTLRGEKYLIGVISKFCSEVPHLVHHAVSAVAGVQLTAVKHYRAVETEGQSWQGSGLSQGNA